MRSYTYWMPHAIVVLRRLGNCEIFRGLTSRGRPCMPGVGVLDETTEIAGGRIWWKVDLDGVVHWAFQPQDY